jgi:hypothetical protein
VTQANCLFCKAVPLERDYPAKENAFRESWVKTIFSTLFVQDERDFLHMNTILSRINSLCRILIIAFVSLSLWGSTFVAPVHAIGGAGDGIERASDGIEYYKNDRGEIQTTERYDQIQPETGGMNKFDDVDPRLDTRGTDAKAKALTDTANRRKAQASDPLEPARKTIRNAKDRLGDNVSEAADKLGDNVSEAADKLGNKIGG